MLYYTAELHYIGPMIAFVVDDVDNHDDDQVIVNDVNDDDNHDDKHGENAIGQVCYNDVDNHSDDESWWWWWCRSYVCYCWRS